MSILLSGRILLRPERGHSIHLGGPWYVVASPDSGLISYTKDHGTGTHVVEQRLVPVDVRVKAEGVKSG